EYLICRYKYRNWRVGFGPIPIVFSTNLFLWFKDPYWGWQYAMIFLAFASREFLRWRRNGRDVHIFNPSAFALCVIALALIIGQWPHLTYGQQISITLGRPPYMYEYIFLMGVVVQWFFRVTLVTMSAAVTSWVVGVAYFGITGEYMYVDTVIPIAVFLGMNLLVTDPSSSPDSNGGKVLFGMLYGLAVFFMYDVLRDAGRPAVGQEPGFHIAWLDKLLFLPFLNLLARPLDRVGALFSLDRWGWRLNAVLTNRVHVGIWTLAFVGLLPRLIDHPGRSLAFWEGSCAEQGGRACENVALLLQRACRGDIDKACYNLGILFNEGKGVPVDLGRAGGAFKRACDLELGSGCRQLGLILGQRGPWYDAATAAQLFARGCEFNDALACTYAGDTHLKGIGVNQDTAKAKMSFELGCDRKEAQACHQLGHGWRTGLWGDVNLKHAAAAYRVGCDQGHSASCTFLGTMLWLGDGVPRDRTDGRRILSQACNDGYQAACQQRSRLDQAGESLK
ncbi:MAG: tetratricopeptide repeat protein, partial [Myxococcota bacterium]|nr:tetratricopeptide repeat protein [Myxococcota bacterium]